MADRPLVFLGTPEPAAIILESLVSEGRNVVHVITGADKRRGRGSATSPTPVNVVAARHGIAVSHDLAWFDGEIPVDVMGVVVAFGRIIPARVLERAPMWNVHFSLLPRWRGAAPVARAILAGDNVTGVCVMEMEEGLDTGGVIASSSMAIEDDATTESLTARLATVGARLLGDALDLQHPRSVPQTGDPVYAHKIDPSELVIDWTMPAVRIHRQVRAVRAHSMAGGKRIRVLEVAPVAVESVPLDVPGSISPEGIVVTGDGVLRLVRVQPEGRPVMSVEDWMRGRQGEHLRFD